MAEAYKKIFFRFWMMASNPYIGQNFKEADAGSFRNHADCLVFSNQTKRLELHCFYFLFSICYFQLFGFSVQIGSNVSKHAKTHKYEAYNKNAIDV